MLWPNDGELSRFDRASRETIISIKRSFHHTVTKYFLGVDIGGTKSHALVADETGQALGLGVGGAGNYEVVG